MANKHYINKKIAWSLTFFTELYAKQNVVYLDIYHTPSPPLSDLQHHYLHSILSLQQQPCEED